MSTVAPLVPLALAQDVIEAVPLPLSVFEVITPTDVRFIMENQASRARAYGITIDKRGKLLQEIIAPAQAARTAGYCQQCLATNTTLEVESSYNLPSGMIWTHNFYTPFSHAEERNPYVLAMWQDITARKVAEQAERQQQLEIIDQQAALLAEHSTPILAISDTTVVVPLVGTVDSRRVKQLMHTLLTGVGTHHATTVIIDITGVPIVDTQVANALIHAAQAVQLLGAQVVLTGIRPEVAQTLVGLGIDLSAIVTRGTLRDGIKDALR